LAKALPALEEAIGLFYFLIYLIVWNNVLLCIIKKDILILLYIFIYIIYI
jgi:hypothetical protein